MAIKLTLHGAYKGRNITLNGVKFIDGVAVLEGDAVKNEGLIKYMGLCYQAHPEGYEAPAAEVEPKKTAEEEPVLEVGDVIEVDGRAAEITGFAADGTPELKFLDEDPGEGKEGEVNEKLVAAIKALDPKDDGHWTKHGKPQMAAVEKLYGSAGITRDDVEAAVPGYDRDQAKAAAAAQ